MRRLLIWPIGYLLMVTLALAQAPPRPTIYPDGLLAHLAAESARLRSVGATDLTAAIPPHDWRALLALRGLPADTLRVEIEGVSVTPQVQAGPYIAWSYRYWAR